MQRGFIIIPCVLVGLVNLGVIWLDEVGRYSLDIESALRLELINFLFFIGRVPSPDSKLFVMLGSF